MKGDYRWQRQRFRGSATQSLRSKNPYSFQLSEEKGRNSDDKKRWQVPCYRLGLVWNRRVILSLDTSTDQFVKLKE